METKVENKRRIVEGKVVSAKMQGTVKVLVESKMSHPVYKKVINRRKIYFAHTSSSTRRYESFVS